VPPATGAPVLALRAPLGVFLPAGLALDVDGAGRETFQFQACDNNGCYAGGPLSESLLGGMTRGQKLNIKFQNLNKQTITVAATLVGFTAAFQRIQ
jgi:invasion protein IalB